ncbi:MAG: hypothetical protein IM607_12365 [Cytophagales bacterium]|nr:hypothetical protein [Cytophagales bacterium]
MNTINQIFYNNNLSFVYDETAKLWRCICKDIFFNGQEIDIEINQIEFNWNDIESFFSYLVENKNYYLNSLICDTTNVLKCMSCIVYKKHNQLEYLDFVLTGVSFKGISPSNEDSKIYLYDLYFTPINLREEFYDWGAFIWSAKFRNSLLISVSCDR